MLALRRSIRTGSYRVDGRSADSLTLTDAASNCGCSVWLWAEPLASDNASAASANQIETGGTGAAYWRFMSSSNEDDTNARFSGGETWEGRTARSPRHLGQTERQAAILPSFECRSNGAAFRNPIAGAESPYHRQTWTPAPDRGALERHELSIAGKTLLTGT